MKAEVVVWRHRGDWMKVYIDGKLVRATHESDYEAEWWVELARETRGSITLREATEDEDERK